MMDQGHPRAVTDLVNRLVDALTGRGLVAEPVGANMVRVANRAADPPAGDPLGARMGPGLSQTVICRPADDGRLWWSWLWADRGQELEYERFCEGVEITKATDAIVRVLAVRPVDERAGA